MSDEVMATITTHTHPTVELRWLVLTAGPNAIVDRREYRLQQQWSITTYGPGDAMRQDYEWRDVPTAERGDP